MVWVQVYDPCGSPFWSTLLAALPIIALLGLLAGGVDAPKSALAGLIAALLVAIFGFGMPAVSAMASAAYGACFGLLPIGWIVVASVFLFHLTVMGGQFEVVKRSVAALSPDRRVQALLIAFCFGTFLEGAAGFGTPVAICSALMIGLGFSPLYAAGLALIANTSPVAFGALGTPIITLAKVSGLDEMALSQMAGRQLPIFSLIVPAWLVAVMSGWRGVIGCWPAILVCGGTFAFLQFVMSNFHGPALVDVVGGLGSLIVLAAMLRFWQPKIIWRFPNETVSATVSSQTLTKGKIIFAWMPWVFLSVLVFTWGSLKVPLNGGADHEPNALAGYTKFSLPVPGLHNRIYRAAPVAPVAMGADRAVDAEKAVFEIPWLGTTGTGIFLAAILTAFWLRIPADEFFRQFRLTVWEMRWALFTIAAMLAHSNRATLSLFCTVAGVAGCCIDWQRHFVECVVRKFATHYGRTAWTESDFDCCIQQHWRCDGKNDRCSKHCGCSGGDRANRRRRGDFAIRLLAQRRTRCISWCINDASGLFFDMDDPRTDESPVNSIINTTWQAASERIRC